MRKITISFLTLVLFLMLAINSVHAAPDKYVGGLLNGQPLQIGSVLGQATGTIAKMTDNNESTTDYLQNGNFAWYTFTSPVEISAVLVSRNDGMVIEFYDANNKLLTTYNSLNTDGIQSLPETVKNVSTVVLKKTTPAVGISEWNVFTTPPIKPISTTIEWIQSGDKMVTLDWAITGAKAYNVKRATTSGGHYDLLAENVKGNTYTDKTVTNGTTYYYVVSAVNEAGESAHSPERPAKPSATAYTGGLLDGLKLNIGKTFDNPTGTIRKFTDNDVTTWDYLQNGNFVWHKFAAPVEISAVLVATSDSMIVEFYDANNKLLTTYKPLNIGGIQSLPDTVKNVSTVVLKTTKTAATIQEWNVYGTPSVVPLATTIEWIYGGDQHVRIDWKSTGAKTYNVKRSTTPNGSYDVIAANVKGTSYTDKTVTNGTTYYYVVSATNEAGESANSPEKSVNPAATKYTGGLLDGVILNSGKNISQPTGIERKLTDNNVATGEYVNNEKFVWYSFANPVEINALIVNSSKVLGSVVEFYDDKQNLLYSYSIVENDKVEAMPAPVKNVTTVVLKHPAAKFMEWNVFGKGGELPIQAPLDLTATAGDKRVVLTWGKVDSATGYNVKRSTVAGGLYTTIATVDAIATSYTDINVTNGVTYYYVVTAVKSGAESAESNEASATPNAAEVTPPDPETEDFGDRALLRITLNTGIQKEFDLSMREVNEFIDWYEARAAGKGKVMFAFNKHNNNKGPFKARKDYVFFDKIITFEVNSYDSGVGQTGDETETPNENVIGPELSEVH
ncbi:hypothetical protein [Paenibacillus agilis]|uniref:hypothetical protein n=1 Tax=Paenibacillus agilis TaxID=3020863 RepID=UPI0016497E4C|nr:hypothetical protein [Paenibacillus agilis]